MAYNETRVELTTRPRPPLELKLGTYSHWKVDFVNARGQVFSSKKMATPRNEARTDALGNTAIA